MSLVNRRTETSNPTIVDVATAAGVSLGTASRVLNHRRGVDPELIRKVNNAASALNYVRSATARRATRETAPVITFVLSNRDFLHPVHARLLQGAEEFCEENGYFVVFKKFDYQPDANSSVFKLPTLLRDHRIADCLILAGTNYPNLIEATERARVPYVLFGNNLVSSTPQAPFDQVRSDDHGGSVEAVHHLIGLGHRRICFIGDIAQRWYADRYEAYRRVMNEANLEPIAQTVALSPDNFSNGYASAEAMLRRNVPITAVFAAADDVAFGVWELLRQSGRRVPDDISLVGFGDLPGSNLKVPPLTTVRQPCLEIGRQLARMAIKKAHAPFTAIAETVVPTELVLRGTTLALVVEVTNFARSGS